MKIKKQLFQLVKIQNCQAEDELKGENILEYKILVLGDSLVGKTSICTKFAFNNFSLEIKQSTKINCYAKQMKLFNDYIQVYLVDVHSNILKNPMSNLYIDVKGAIFVYDITKFKSFDLLNEWVENIKIGVGKKIPFILVGNKNDLLFLRKIEYEKGINKAKELNCEFFETSCIDEDSVNEAIKFLISQIYYEDLSDEDKEKIKSMKID